MSRLEIWKEKVERRLCEIFEPEGPEELTEAMAYYLFQSGKRVRPLLTVAVASALGGNERDAITAGCVIEMVHNYSLIHDDLPAMDDDDFRRGMPTCHRKFGEAVAILAGDALLTYAFEVITSTDFFEELKPEDLLRLSHVLAVKSGATGMVGGQVLDIGGTAELSEINPMKTGALFEACFLYGGVIAHRMDILKELEHAGRLFGELFQITDDILDRDGYYELLGLNRSLKKAEGIKKELESILVNMFKEVPSEIDQLVNMVYGRVT